MAAGLQVRPELQGSGRSVWWCGCPNARDVRPVIGCSLSVRTLSLAHPLEPRDAIGGRLASREGLGRCGLPGSPDPRAVWPPEWVPRRQGSECGAPAAHGFALPGNRGVRVLGWGRRVGVSPRSGVVSGSPGGERNAGPAFHPLPLRRAAGGGGSSWRLTSPC